ncbi:phosphatase PAP2 family protein [Streptomyces sp. B93]|uniref:phosphatase PAP2 family protein n=1 Tax=Streptomyces sp. B93 TaxID=2824875 RepID=UPI001B366E31|nr:phosphatase PAP2 family protein [Streptomyces sp. B93]MBQ1093088.1 phosphatase PAP2 family protein [Streptomyces sp. B93]
MPDSPIPPRRSLALSTAAAVVFALVTWQVAVDGPLLDADERAGREFVRRGWLAELFADLGGVPVAVPVLLVVAVGTAWWARARGVRRWWLPGVVAVGAMALVPLVVVPLKELTDRGGTAVTPGTGFYPSGHTATAAVAYGCAALLVLPWLRGRRGRRWLVGGCLAVNLGVGAGLVRQGYHWPLDVVGSWCLAVLLLTAFAGVVSRSSCRTSAGTPSRRSGPS